MNHELLAWIGLTFAMVLIALGVAALFGRLG